MAVTGPSQPSFEPTDIPHDFNVVSPGRIVTIPPGATHLFISPAEVYYIDNTDPDLDFAARLTGLGAVATGSYLARLEASGTVTVTGLSLVR